MKNQTPTQGLIAPPFTPMRTDGQVDLDRIPVYAEFLRRNGVAGAFVAGTTGESMSLSTEERIQISRCWVEVVQKDFRVIVHVGHNSIVESRTLAAHAQQIGAFGIAVMPPFFFRPKTVEDLVEFCREVAASAASTPFYYYHIPKMTAVDFSMPEFLHMAGQRIPTMAGMKFTHTNLMDYLTCLEMDNGRYDMLFGEDGLLLSALSIGAQGAVGTTYNLAAPMYRKIMEAYHQGDIDTARNLQIQVNRMIDFLVRSKHGIVPTGKAVMKLIGMDCGSVRLPLRDLNSLEYGQLEFVLHQIGFFDYCCR